MYDMLCMTLCIAIEKEIGGSYFLVGIYGL